jgi:hypothetical protein
MKMLTKLAVGAAMMGGLAMATTAPAEAGVSVGIHLGGYHHGCYHCGYHPAYHHYYHPVVVGVGPYYWHGRHWYHRRFYHGYWRYY